MSSEGESKVGGKQEIVSVTYEEIGLFPRSFSRVLDRFLKQVFSDVDNLVIQEYRFYRYLFLTTVRCLFILFFVPFLVNFVAKNYLIHPLTEYYWNTKQTEIFLNSYQQKRAFSELKEFEEKLYFESLIYSKTAPQKGFSSIYNDHSLDNSTLKVESSVNDLSSQANLSSLTLQGQSGKIDSLGLSTELSFLPGGTKSPSIGYGLVPESPNRGQSAPLTELVSLQDVPPAPYGVLRTKDTGARRANGVTVSPKNLGGMEYPNSVSPLGVSSGPRIQSTELTACPKVASLALRAPYLSGGPVGPTGQGQTMGGSPPGCPNPLENPGGTLLGPFPQSIYSLALRALVLAAPMPEVPSPYPLDTGLPLKPCPQGIGCANAFPEVLSPLMGQGLTPSPLMGQGATGLELVGPAGPRDKGLLMNSSTPQPVNTTNVMADTNSITSPANQLIYNTLSYSIEPYKKLQEKTIEIATRYNNQSIEAITNFFADCASLITLLYLLFVLEIQINITKSFLLEVFFGLDDSKKSLFILLITDLLVGYHSSNIWELFFEFLFNHYGLPESQTGIFLLVATLPVLLDVLFKYLIFRHLNRSSPATVATYHAMIE